MNSLWEEPARRGLRDRIARLTPAQPARWGRMAAPAMVAHLADSLRMAVGDLHVASKRLPLRYPPLKQLVVHWLPIPKNVPTAPELIQRPPGDWTSEVSALDALLEQFARRDRGGAWPDHPAFGALTGAQWGVLVYRHMDHHLRQFGV